MVSAWGRGPTPLAMSLTTKLPSWPRLRVSHTSTGGRPGIGCRLTLATVRSSARPTPPTPRAPASTKRETIRMPGSLSASPACLLGGLRRALSPLVRGATPNRAQVDRDQLGNTRLFHGDPVERIGDLHGALVVGDDDELRAIGHLANEVVEA